MELTGIKYRKDTAGRNRYLQIDLNKYGESPLLEDFLDMLDVEARKDEPSYPLGEVIERENKRRGLGTNDSVVLKT
jgi:hypothetical protein